MDIVYLCVLLHIVRMVLLDMLGGNFGALCSQFRFFFCSLFFYFFLYRNFNRINWSHKCRNKSETIRHLHKEASVFEYGNMVSLLNNFSYGFTINSIPTRVKFIAEAHTWSHANGNLNVLFS